MVHKHFCDVCGCELLKGYGDLYSPTGYFNYQEDFYDLCKHCGERVKHFIEEEKERYAVFGVLKKKLIGMKNQKKLTDFDQEESKKTRNRS